MFTINCQNVCNSKVHVEIHKLMCIYKASDCPGITNWFVHIVMNFATKFTNSRTKLGYCRKHLHLPSWHLDTGTQYILLFKDFSGMTYFYFRNIINLNRLDRLAQLAEHWTSIPKVTGSIPTARGQANFSACHVWMHILRV